MDQVNNTDKNILIIDEQSFKMLYQSYWKKVFLICYSTLNDKDIAAELAQNIFESLWRRRHHLKIHTSIEQYLFRSARLEVIEFCRTSATRQKHLQNIILEQPKECNQTQHAVEYKDLVSKLNSLLNTLPQKSREVYRMSQQEGLDKKTISSMLLMSEKMVEYYLYKALHFIRKNIERG